MIIFLYGPDTYRSRQKLSALKQKFISQKDKNELNVSNIVYGNDLTVDELRKTVLTSGLFSKKRLIIIEGSLKNQVHKSTQKKTDTVTEETINILKKSRQDKDNIIIFWEEEVKQKELTNLQKKLYQLLKKQKYAQEFTLLKPGQIKDWIKKEVEKQGIKIEQKATNLLTDIYGNNLWFIKNELDKLIAAQNNSFKIIQLKDLKNTVSSKVEQNIWQLTDALGQKNKKLALRLLCNQLKTGTNIDYLISMLAYQYRIIFRIKSYIKNNQIYSHYQLAKKLSLHPFVCQKGLQQEKNYTLEELKKIYNQLLTIDLLRKTKPINPEILLDLLIIKN